MTVCCGDTPRSSTRVSRLRSRPRQDPPHAADQHRSPERRLRRARTAVGACFFVNAVLYANLIPRFPEVKAELGLSNAALGTALAALPLGALLAGLSSAPLIRRFGSARVASGGLTLLAAAVWAAAAAPNWAALAGGAARWPARWTPIVDVAQNAHGLRVQRGYGRSILNAFHGLWSIGAVTGGLLGSAAAGLGVPLPAAPRRRRARLRGSRAARAPRPAPRPRRRRPGGRRDRSRRRPAARGRAVRRRTAAAHAWRARRPRGLRAPSWRTPAARGARSTSATSSARARPRPGSASSPCRRAMTIGRLTGDRVVDRFGQRRVARAGGA